LRQGLGQQSIYLIRIHGVRSTYHASTPFAS
jgi:hypothetical protein